MGNRVDPSKRVVGDAPPTLDAKLTHARNILRSIIGTRSAPAGWPYGPLSEEDETSIAAFAVLRAVRKYRRTQGTWASWLRLWVLAEMKAYLPCLGRRRQPSRTGQVELTNEHWGRM
jgi:hypothetical protein